MVVARTTPPPPGPRRPPPPPPISLVLLLLLRRIAASRLLLLPFPLSLGLSPVAEGAEMEFAKQNNSTDLLGRSVGREHSDDRANEYFEKREERKHKRKEMRKRENLDKNMTLLVENWKTVKHATTAIVFSGSLRDFGSGGFRFGCVEYPFGLCLYYVPI